MHEVKHEDECETDVAYHGEEDLNDKSEVNLTFFFFMTCLYLVVRKIILF